MRKLLKITFIFALAFIFSAGIAFGQSNDANVDQAGQNNNATIEQVGQNNQATVGQGTHTTAFVVDPYGIAVDQTGPATSEGNEATTSQSGQDNVAVHSQGMSGPAASRSYSFDNVGTIEQVGFRNFAETAQGTYGAYAENNELTIVQDGNRNDAFVHQGYRDSHVAENNVAEVFQDGNRNFGKTQQIGSNHFADVDQIGNRNTANVTQSN